MTEHPEQPTYTFGRRTSGDLLGLSHRAFAAAVAGALLVVLPLALLAGLLPAAGAAIVIVAVAWVPGPGGRPAREVAWACAAWAWRAMRAGEAGAPATPLADPTAPRPFGALEVSERAGIGVAQLAGTSRYAASWRITPIRDFALLSDDEAERCLESYGATLDALAGMGEVVSVSWHVTTVADLGGDPSAWLRDHAASATPDALADYGTLLDGLVALAHRQIVVTIVVAPRSASPAALAGALAAVDRHLQAADLAGARVVALTAGALVTALAAVIRPDAATLPPPLGDPGAALGSWWAENACTVNVGSWRTRTLSINQLPRKAVSAEWLAPLLAASPDAADRMVVSVHMEPVPAWKAMRQAEVATTSAESEARRRERAGFSTRSRDLLSLSAQAQREEEVAAGHATFEVRAQVVVSAPSAERLEQAAQDALAAIGRAHCEASTPWGEQLAGWRASAPLGLPPPSPAFFATTRQVRSLFPGQVAAHGDAAGLVLGSDRLSGGPWCYEPFEAYGVVTSPNLVVLGELGRGKSAAVKALCSRGSGLLGRRVIVLDPKGEYAPLASQLGIPLLALKPGGSVRLNPLATPDALGEQARSAMRRDLLAALAEAQLRRELDPLEGAALGWLARELPPEATLGDATAALLDPPPGLAEALRLDTTAALDALRAMGLALDGLVSGHLAGMFDGDATVDLSRAERGFVVDLSAATSSPKALAPILAAALAAVMSAIASAATPTYLVVDEAWAVLGGGGVDYLRAVAKLSRSLGVSLVLVLHRLGDLAAAGDDASAVAKRSRGLFAEAQTVLVFSQAPAEAALLGVALDLSIKEVAELSRLTRGEALAIVGSSHRLVDVLLTAHDLPMSDTDAAMRAASERHPATLTETDHTWRS